MLLASAIIIAGATFLIENTYADMKLEEMKANVELLRQLVTERESRCV